MDCRVATELMLEADTAELQGNAGALAEHLRSCAECRARAALILREQNRLHVALTSLSGARAAARPNRSLRRYVPRLLLPLTAAAALALIFWQESWQRGEPLPPLLVPATRIAEVPVVNARADRNVAVMRTSDPRITVVWYY